MMPAKISAAAASNLASTAARPRSPKSALLDPRAKCGEARGSSQAALTTYPGGKNGAGVYQRLICLMPPHRRYVEAFLGSGAVLRRKRPAVCNVGIDVDRSIIARHSASGHARGVYAWQASRFICADAREWIAREKWCADDLLYCDPPYLGSARSGGRRPIYRHEILSEADHVELLELLAPLPAMVMISGYPSSLYDHYLRGWTRIEYEAMTRGGPATEVVWFNYEMPTALHDYRYLGRNFRERLRIARKIKRWACRLRRLPTLERAAIMDALREEAL
jgi:DNA adenine methylase